MSEGKETLEFLTFNVLAFVLILGVAAVAEMRMGGII